MMNNKLIGIIIVILLLGAGGYYIFNKNLPGDEPVFCTADAKLCPDGSYVGRTGPKCEFAKCPSSEIKEGTAASIGETILNNGIKITPLLVVSDSRCPSDVTCIWAGEVTLNVRLESETKNEEVVLKLQTPTTFDGRDITLTEVSPGTISTKTIDESDYRFTFEVKPQQSSQSGVGTISGRVTLSPVCPVERIPPDPACDPKPYTTSIQIRKEGAQTVLKTIESNKDGYFSTTIDPGSYELSATNSNGSILPRCEKVVTVAKANQSTTSDISCDTGIR